jgi:hypothetical protein
LWASRTNVFAIANWNNLNRDAEIKDLHQSGDLSRLDEGCHIEETGLNIEPGCTAKSA